MTIWYTVYDETRQHVIIVEAQDYRCQAGVGGRFGEKQTEEPMGQCGRITPHPELPPHKWPSTPIGYPLRDLPSNIAAIERHNALLDKKGE